MNEEEYIERIIDSWGSEQSQEQLIDLLNDHYSQDDELAMLVIADYDNAEFLEVTHTWENETEYGATVMVEIEDVKPSACKDCNNSTQRIGYAKAIIVKEHQQLEVKVTEVFSEPCNDYY